MKQSSTKDQEGMKNRLGVTVRFNLNEQQDLRALMEFFKTNDPIRVVKLAFSQLVVGVKELQNKLAAQQQEEDNAKRDDNANVSSADAADSGGSEIVPDTNSGSTSGDGASDLPAPNSDAAG